MLQIPNFGTHQNRALSWGRLMTSEVTHDPNQQAASGESMPGLESTFLTSRELKQLTGYSFSSKQTQWLRANGFSVFVNAAGAPRVCRIHVGERMRGIDPGAGAHITQKFIHALSQLVLERSRDADQIATRPVPNFTGLRLSPRNRDVRTVVQLENDQPCTTIDVKAHR
jgi:hypothetical protein